MKRLFGALACTLLISVPSAQAQDWKLHRTTDNSGRDVIWIASIQIVARHTDYEFYVSCRSSDEVIVAFSAPYVDPRAESYLYYDFFAMDLRFDGGEAKKTHFVRQQHVMFLSPSPLMVELAKYDKRGVAGIRAQQQQVFIKMLAAHRQLRVSFPHVDGSLVLKFPLNGAKEVLLTLAEHCGIHAAAGSEFQDAEGKAYSTLVDMLRDDSWLSRQ